MPVLQAAKSGRPRRFLIRLKSELRYVLQGGLFGPPALSIILPTAYLLSFGLILLIPADFWEDISRKNTPDLIRLGNFAGAPQLGYISSALLALPYPELAGRVSTLVILFVSALVFRRFLAKLHLFESHELNCITLLTACMPLFQSRFMIALHLHSISILLFAIAAHMLLVAWRYGSLTARLLAHVLFIISFFFQSLLVLYGLLFLLLLISDVVQSGPNRTPLYPAVLKWIVALIRRAPDFLLLPFFFFLVKPVLFPSQGPMIGHNAVTWQGISQAIPKSPLAAVEAVTSALTIPVSLPIILLAAASLLAAWFAWRVRQGTSGYVVPEAFGSNGSEQIIRIAVAYAGAVLAVFPYVVVNKEVSPYGFEDRNQVPLWFVTGALVLFTIQFIARARLVWPMASALLVIFVAQNITTYTAIIVDGHTQNAFVQTLARNDSVRNHRSFLVDETLWPNFARRRAVSTFELNCHMKAAFGDESRYAAHWTGPNYDWGRDYQVLELFRGFSGTCHRQFDGRRPELLLAIRPGSRSLSSLDGIYLSWLRMTDRNRYFEELEGVITIVAVPLGPDDSGKGIVVTPMR